MKPKNTSHSLDYRFSSKDKDETSNLFVKLNRSGHNPLNPGLQHV